MTRYTVGGVALVVLVAAAFGLLASADTARPGPGEERNVTPGQPAEPPAFDGSGGLVVPVDVWTVGGVLLAALAVVVGYLFVTAGRATALSPDEPPIEDDPDLAAMGRAAGRAADRIEAEGDLHNEVYRAWYEMTRHLSVPAPETTTSGEFADRAVAAGMDDGDVSRLTRLFEEVRYGGASPADRERRAVETLRRIEEAYGDGDGDDAPEADGEPNEGGDDDASEGTSGSASGEKQDGRDGHDGRDGQDGRDGADREGDGR